MFNGAHNEGLHPVDAKMQKRKRENAIGEWIRLKILELRAKSQLDALERQMHPDDLLDAGLHLHGLDLDALIPRRRSKKK